MTQQEFDAIYPAIYEWLKLTLHRHALHARPVISCGFTRLPEFYDASTLSSSKVVAVENIPVPPLSSMGLTRFGGFERMKMAGITYLDTFFVQADQAWDESLHFHELVHILQWRILGPERFLWLYADGLERFGYRNSPLEVMAFELQNRFDSESHPFNVASEVGRLLSNSQ